MNFLVLNLLILLSFQSNAAEKFELYRSVHIERCVAGNSCDTVSGHIPGQNMSIPLECRPNGFCTGNWEASIEYSNHKFTIGIDVEKHIDSDKKPYYDIEVYESKPLRRIPVGGIYYIKNRNKLKDHVMMFGEAVETSSSITHRPYVQIGPLHPK
jgi:hypothetical protein